VVTEPTPTSYESLRLHCGQRQAKPGTPTDNWIDPYPLCGLAELFDTIGREIRTDQLDPRNSIRRSAVAWPASLAESSMPRDSKSGRCYTAAAWQALALTTSV
jgi:hypothetical protein